MNDSDDKFETEMMLEIAVDDRRAIEKRFPAENACLHCFSPVVTLDKNVFGGRSGGLALELLTLIQWALEGKQEYTFDELEI